MHSEESCVSARRSARLISETTERNLIEMDVGCLQANLLGTF
jgi:hypothetical protein